MGFLRRKKWGRNGVGLLPGKRVSTESFILSLSLPCRWKSKGRSQGTFLKEYSLAFQVCSVRVLASTDELLPGQGVIS